MVRSLVCMAVIWFSCHLLYRGSPQAFLITWRKGSVIIWIIKDLVSAPTFILSRSTVHVYKLCWLFCMWDRPCWSYKPSETIRDRRDACLKIQFFFLFDHQKSAMLDSFPFGDQRGICCICSCKSNGAMTWCADALRLSLTCMHQ